MSIEVTIAVRGDAAFARRALARSAFARRTALRAAAAPGAGNVRRTWAVPFSRLACEALLSGPKDAPRKRGGKTGVRESVEPARASPAPGAVKGRDAGRTES